MRLAPALLLCGMVVGLSACTEEKTAPSPPGGDIYCGEENRYRCRDDALGLCGVDGKWAYESCESICAEQNLVSDGTCGYVQELGHDFCRCESPCCEEGETRCSKESAEDDVLETCRDCEWQTTDCLAFCASVGGTSLGCGHDAESGLDACLCEGGATPLCGPNFVKCQGTFLNICPEGGSYGAIDCRAECEADGLYFDECDLDPATPEEVCKCRADAESILCRSVQPTCREDELAVCENDHASLLSCADECAAIGMAYVGCKEDPDRGHDACFCSLEEEGN
ncbi:MAG: hypothetical protein C4523_02180 [Myxococcales bacterium]|nr:MAG: hypothetical protein C4523_02180 [Myxococcales bacterium]